MIEKLKYCLSWIKEHKHIFTNWLYVVASAFKCIFNWLKVHRRVYISCLSILLATSIVFAAWLNFSIYTVNVFDGETTYTVHTLNNNVTAVFSRLALKSNNYDIKNTTVKGRTTLVEIEYNFPVFITVGDNTSTITFTGGTVSDALTLAGFTIDEFDFVEPAPETVLTETTYIDYTDINYVNSTYTEVIHYKTETEYSDSLEKGKTKTLQKGSEGLREVTLSEKFVNGESVEKTVTDTKVLTAAVNAKKIVGTKVTEKTNPAVATYSSAIKAISTLTPDADIALDANGNPINYKSKMTCRATAYTYTGSNCATGVAPRPGYIAVNPKVIPYGTKLYIKSADGSVIYGYAVAADTGGFVKKHPNGIDLFMPTQSACSSFGVRNMEVYILG